MDLLNLLGVDTAYADTVAKQPHPGNIFSMLWLPLLLVLVFYFLLIRPQTKRAKEHRQLLSTLSLGEEVVTTGGIIGKITQLKDNFIVLEVAKGSTFTIQKNAIASLLPKGTIDSV